MYICIVKRAYFLSSYVVLVLLTASINLLLKKSMLAKKIGAGILKTITPFGSLIWRDLRPSHPNYIQIWTYRGGGELLLKMGLTFI